MAAIKCPHCGEFTSSTLETCTECHKLLSETPSADYRKRRRMVRWGAGIVVLLLLSVSVVWILAAVRTETLLREQQAFEQLDSCTDLQAFEDFFVKYPNHDSMEVVRARYETLLAAREEAIRQAAAESAARELEQRMAVTPEESSLLQICLENFMSAMSACDSSRIDELVADTLLFCGLPRSNGASVVAYFQQNLQRDDVLGVHFRLGDLAIAKQPVENSSALSYSVETEAQTTFNRLSLDSTMTASYRILSTFSPDKRLTSFQLIRP